MTTRQSPSPKTIEKLLLYLAISTLVILVIAFFSANSIPDETLKGFIQSITSNVASTVFAFIVIYIFITSQNIFPSPENNIEKLRKETQKSIDALRQNISQDIQSITEQKIEDISQKIENLIEAKFPLGVTDNNIEIDRLYRLYGLKAEERMAETTFQDFKIDRRSRNINAVSYLWADTYTGDKINASIMKLEGLQSYFLRVQFDSKPNGYGCNLAIRPQDEKPLSNRPPTQKRYLKFQARIPRENQTQDGGNLQEIALAFRVINGYMQHWEYAPHRKEYTQILLSGEDWQTYYLNIADATQWSLFDADGNTVKGPTNANFDVIVSVVIKVGSYTEKGELGPGKGIIDIQELELSNSRS